ncbi:MAG: hypothetical protein A3C71_02655 [Candidatus Yanofskybacteria bacterium RIFCSPHIGHO2_02_FULL_43_15c]|uniref:TrpR like protein, YerC/YecD n=1 Tax=Candidatus Yanofskybacteria bacterium RIFCSPHIGHO2_02_FULL_43_15c TaxID=1802679 RepID=A0A1F8FM57_9BACT|nr:MAG: hypothetical protein A3C71_02655 [Candidatus Yanofskybacteria bacterium RIFCSPHIGHO2_02_FULL_43_15c]
MKVRPRKIKEKDRIKYLDALYTAITVVHSREEVKKFLRDLLTESERIMIGRRILIAQKLLDGESYNQIIKEMGVGMDTIGRVAHWLDDQSDGYERAVKEMKKDFGKRFKKNESTLKNTLTMFGAVKRKYPWHFLFWNILDQLKDTTN